MKNSANNVEYSYFTMLVSVGGEFSIIYKDVGYWVSQRLDLHEIYFTISEETYFIFHSPEQLFEAKVLDGKTLYELWEDLYVTG